MTSMSVLWADQMRAGKLSRSDAWTSFHSTIWRSLAYPLPAINLSKKQCEVIMMPAIRQLLVSIGVCRNFPRCLVFAPTKYLGLGKQHIHTNQEIQRLLNMLEHTSRNTNTGKLYRASTEHLILEVVMGQE
jgi:hypothetical protein